jgi:galactokinase
MTQINLLELFQGEFGRDPQVRVQAPGRVNTLGEHTDYNDGFVLPAAIDFCTTVYAALHEAPRILVRSANFGQLSRIDLDEVKRDEETTWSNYLRGVVAEYRKRGYTLCGMDVAIGGNVPIGSGLSSSASLEVAFAETCRLISNLVIPRVDMALLCQAAERNFVGVQCGIMDQFVSTLAQQGAVLFVDCRDLSYQAVPLSQGVSLVVCDSMVKRRLDGSEYNRRRRECEESVAELKPELGRIRALRDVTLEQLEQHRRLLSPVLYQRAHHVVAENTRVVRGIQLLRTHRIEEFGLLLYQSHATLRDEYEVSCKELDWLVELAQAQAGVLGARMTGAGFGGCTVNLVRSERVEEFRQGVSAGYEAKTGKRPLIYACQPSQGVRSERL